MAEEHTFSREEGEGQVEAELKATQAKMGAVLEGLFNRLDAVEPTAPELAGPQGWWNIWARGPLQAAGLEPSRVIEVGELATIEWVVRLNRRYPINAPMQNACDLISHHNDKIEIFFYTSDMQRMEAVPALSQRYCILTTPGVCYYTGIYRFRPQQPACLYETNICARICNCSNQPLPQYSGFVTWVRNWDYDWLFRYVPWTFDHPIRYMVADKSPCGPCPYP